MGAARQVAPIFAFVDLCCPATTHKKTMHFSLIEGGASLMVLSYKNEDFTP